ncbi:MAG: cell division ATP-binding protein FtsE [Bacillota bacterium]
MIQFHNVTKIYNNGVEALSKINLLIDKGEFVFLVGASGAGKSTIMKLVMRQEVCTAGTILVGRKNVATLRAWGVPFLRRNIGVIYQDFKLLPNKTVYENVAFALEVVEVPRREILRQVPLVLELVKLQLKANAFPSELSGGEQQRVSIARAIVNKPLVLLADEPTGNLDPETSWGIMDLLQEINKRGTTIIMATHNKEIVNALRKRVVVLVEGKIVKDVQKGDYTGEA